MLLTLNDDVRVILINSDRLVWSLEHLAFYLLKNKQNFIKTLYIYAPIAHRISWFEIKTELEDSENIRTRTYLQIKSSLSKTKDDQNLYIRNFARKFLIN